MPSDAAIRTREQLNQHLAVACELEQGLCLQYLFTAFSLKDDPGEDLTTEELVFVRKWKANILLVAAQEMLHLAQAGNLCASIGGTIQLRRPNFPQSPRYYPTGLPWGLFPFSAETIRLYCCYERPLTLNEEQRRLLGDCRFCQERAGKLLREQAQALASKLPHEHLPERYRDQLPRAVPHETIGELYDAIKQAFLQLRPPPSGELLIGVPEAQVPGDLVDFPEVFRVGSRAQAADAVDLIVRQGEGCPADRLDSHFGVFLNILREYEALKAKRPEFQPARDVHPNPLSRLHVDNTYPGWRLIDDPYTRDVNDLNSSVYEAMVQALYRLFGTPGCLLPQRRLLASTTIKTMTTVIKPLGEALTKLPMGDEGPGDRPRMAGASFEITRDVQLLPFADSAWRVIHERLLELSAAALALAEDPRAREPEHRVAISYLRDAAHKLEGLAGTLGSRPPA